MSARLERIRELDALVVKAARKVRVLGSLQWPDEAEHAFLASVQAGRPEPPRVTLSPPEHLPDERDLAALASEFDVGDPVQQWLFRTLDDVRRTVAMLRSLGTTAFVEWSLRLYGSPHDPAHPGAPSALASARHFLENTQRLQIEPPVEDITDADAAHWMAEQVARFFPEDPPRVELVPHLASRASAGSTRIRLRQGAVFSDPVATIAPS